MDKVIKVINTVQKDDANYYMMTGGANPQTATILNILGENMFQIERFRDAGYDKNTDSLWVFARTGSTQAYKVNNDKLKSNQYYREHFDWKDDSTYEIYLFNTPISSTVKLKHYPLPDFKELQKKIKERHARNEFNKYELEFMRSTFGEGL